MCKRKKEPATELSFYDRPFSILHKPNRHGKAADVEIGFCVILFWWSEIIQIRTISAILGGSLLCWTSRKSEDNPSLSTHTTSNTVYFKGFPPFKQCGGSLFCEWAYFISCSSPSNSGVLKNSPKVMFSPSQIILIVAILGLRLFP